MELVSKSIVFEFINILKNINLNTNVFDTVSDTYNDLEVLDVDLAVPMIKNSKKLTNYQKSMIIDLINYYYDNIDRYVNFSANNIKEKELELFLSKLKETSNLLLLSISYDKLS